MKNFEQWNGFKGNRWKEKIDVRNFIGMNYTPYDGDASFLEGPTEATNKLWGKLQALQKEERAKGGVLDMETEVVTSLTAYGPGYIDEETKDLEKVVGLQTDKPLKRAFMPYGGIKMAEQACETYGYKVSDKIKDVFHNYEFKTHNQGVFDIYTPEMKVARHNKILTGLPDTYGRGRIVGDYRRVALYGIDALIEGKQKDFAACDRQGMRRYDFQLREEIADQIRALKGMKVMAESYGYDISKPAKDAREAFQWLYFGYLAAIKTQNGAAMSVGRISTFLDIYIERDMKNGVLTESEAQELIDHMVMKFRMVKFARIPSYNELFSGDPVWATLEMGGLGQDGRSMVTKNDFRFLHTLENMGPSPEPNLTVLYSERLPENFKKYAEMFPNNQELAWMATRGGQGHAPSAGIKVFENSGHYILRNGWDKTSTMLIHSNNYSNEKMDIWSHNQPDNGTFELYHNGRNFFPDSGVSSYGGSGTPDNIRSWFRQTKSHNTMILSDKETEDNDEPNAKRYGDEDIKNTLGKLIRKGETNQYQFVATENQGYANFTHRRSIFFVTPKEKPFFVIVDEGIGNATGFSKLYFHLCDDKTAESVSLDIENHGAHTTFSDNNNLFIRSFGNADITQNEVKGYISYDTKGLFLPRKAYSLVMDKKENSPVRYITVIYPVANETPEISARFTDDETFIEDAIKLEVTVNGQRYELGYTK